VEYLHTGKVRGKSTAIKLDTALQYLRNLKEHVKRLRFDPEHEMWRSGTKFRCSTTTLIHSNQAQCFLQD